MLIEIKSFAFLQTNQREIYKEEKSCIKKKHSVVDNLCWSK